MAFETADEFLHAISYGGELYKLFDKNLFSVVILQININCYLLFLERTSIIGNTESQGDGESDHFNLILLQ